MAMANYVKFLRGTIDAYKRLPHKDSDALYFVTENKDSEYGKLYLGDKLIGIDVIDTTGGISLKDIKDIVLGENISQDDLLVYDAETKTWSPKPIEQAIQEADLNLLEMVGATADQDGNKGLVPVPKAGMQNLFLRGDATWADPTASLTTVVNNILNGASINANTLAKVEARIVNLENQSNNFALKTVVGNLNNLGNKYIKPTEENPTTVINEINYINERLTWQQISREI